MLWAARSDTQKDADFLTVMGNKQQFHTSEVLGYCSCLQKEAVDDEEYYSKWDNPH